MPTFIRLTDYKDSDSKEQGFFKSENRYEVKQEDFEKIPGSPVAYWVSDRVKEIFEKSEKLGEIAEPRQGMATSDNNRFLRNWSEISFTKIGFNFSNRTDAQESGLKWFPYNKGGEFQKWYGNQEYLVNWENDGEELMGYAAKLYGSPTRTIKNIAHYFKMGITYSFVSSSNFGVRYTPKGFLFDVGGSTTFPKDNEVFYITSFLTSCIASNMLKIVAPTINFQVGDLKALPVIFPKQDSIKQIIDTLTQECIDISKEEWDSRETSWDFTCNELLKHSRFRVKHGMTESGKIEDAYNAYCDYWAEKFTTLHANEKELNRLFIDIYELQDELTPDVELKDITILKQEADIKNGELVFNADEIMKQFISYAVGVMFGRYSLDSEGLLIANMDQEIPSQAENDGVSFEIDDDNVIPVLDDEYFSDDIVSRFINFVKITFGEEGLSENIKFIEECLGKDLRKYFVKDFYPDHIKRYKKRPIYWMVSSPKKGFMSLIYMHRYTSDIFGRVRNSYLTEYIAKLEAHKETLTLTTQSSTASNKDKKDADKQIKNIESKLKEVIAFDRDVMMSYAQNGIDIDLDDGVKVNYCKFKDILYEFDKKLCK